MNNKYKWCGEYLITSSKRGVIGQIKNKITDGGLAALATALTGSPDISIAYFAVGTGAAAVSGAETQLGNETYRVAVTDAVQAGGVVTSTFYLLEGEATGAITEIGIFGGSAASGAANSGTLISRVLWSYTKAADERINITRTDTIGRG